MSQWTQGVGQRRQWKAEEFDGLKPTVYDWVRMAAFLDGEGNLNINPRRNRGHEVQVQVRILIGNETWERRFALKDELHKLNAKGRDYQIVIPVSELTGE